MPGLVLSATHTNSRASPPSASELQRSRIRPQLSFSPELEELGFIRLKTGRAESTVQTRSFNSSMNRYKTASTVQWFIKNRLKYTQHLRRQ